jgi:septal ring-binding cell division protein DamX
MRLHGVVLSLKKAQGQLYTVVVVVVVVVVIIIIIIIIISSSSSSSSSSTCMRRTDRNGEAKSTQNPNRSSSKLKSGAVTMLAVVEMQSCELHCRRV